MGIKKLFLPPSRLISVKHLYRHNYFHLKTLYCGDQELEVDS